jgi:hypothetical protein
MNNVGEEVLFPLGEKEEEEATINNNNNNNKDVSANIDEVIDNCDGCDLNCSTQRSEKNWKLFGHNVPKPEIIFFSQVIIIYVVVITALANITAANGDRTVWISLLCSCLGYLLPSPTLPTENIKSLPNGVFSQR